MGEASSPSMMPTVSPSPKLAHQLPMPPQFLDNTNTKPNLAILPQLVGVATTRVAWDKLVVAYALGSRPYIHELKSQLHTLRCDNANIESHVQKAKGIADKLAALQHPIPNDDLVEFVLAGLGPSFSPFTRSLESRQEDITFDALYELLLDGSRHTHTQKPNPCGCS
ncbi:hypothetical protein KY284_020453 [Solanum tuberosum]|nr:hypothetical protein KY284_020453 [Solanum tuberosum]